MDDDLVRFKSLMEDGKTTAHGVEITRERLASAKSGKESEEEEPITLLEEGLDIRSGGVGTLTPEEQF